MTTDAIRPTTINGIKQLAKKIKREQGITHTQSLKKASQQAGYQNFAHAFRKLPVASKAAGSPGPHQQPATTEAP